MAVLQTGSTNDLVLQQQVSGLTVIPQPTVLTRLNYFDGKFLRAVDLQREQEYLRILVETSNLGGGAGIVHGFDTTLGAGDAINLGAGLAIDGAGRVLMLPAGTSFLVQDLINASRRVPPVLLSAQYAASAGSADFADCTPDVVTRPDTVATGQDFYLLTIGHAEALCGEEDVYGRLCEAACATTTDRPYRVEGVVLRAVPFKPTTPLVTSTSVTMTRTHLRSQLASAYFADEALLVASLISKAGLALDTWCLGAHLAGGQDVPLAVFVRSGTTTVFLDAWTARRERMEAPAKRYWAWRMRMRPWEVLLAQVLQFQCQLHDLVLAAPTSGGAPDPCKPDIKILDDTVKLIDEISTKYQAIVGKLGTAGSIPQAIGSFLPGGTLRLQSLRDDISASLHGLLVRPTNRILINGGIVELPPAGYLPVEVGSVTVNDQVRRLTGEGLDLRFCVVRPDYVAHALEEAQHMDRISLLTGLDHPDARPKVDVLVPDGKVVKAEGTTPGIGVSGQVQINPTDAGSSLALRGAGREETLSSGGWDFAFAGYTEVPTTTSIKVLAQAMSAAATADSGATGTFANLKTTAPTTYEARWSAPDFLSNARMVSGGALRYLGTLSPTTALGGAVFNPGVVRANQPGAFWILFHVEKNLLLLAAGDSTTVMLRHTLVSPGATSASSGINDNLYQGTLLVTNVVRSSASDLTLIGTFSGTLSTTRPAVTGTSLETKLSAMNAAVNVQVSHPAGQDPRVNVSYKLLPGGTGQLLTAVFSGSPLTVEAEVRLVDANNMAGSPYASAKMTVDSTIFASGNPDQALARLALPILAAGLRNTTFAAAAERQLFPPPAPDTGEQIVQPTLDWVLFQRRREAQCGGVAIATYPARTYQLYSVVAKDLTEQNAIVAALTNPASPADALKAFAFSAVDQPQFLGGASALTTPPSSILVDWKAQSPGNILGWAGIADRVAENPFTSQGRLSSVEQAVASVSTPDPQLQGASIPAIPAALDVAGTDGIIVLVTRQLTICHTAYRLALNANAAVNWKASSQAGSLRDLINKKQIIRLGTANFSLDSTAITGGDDIAKRWNTIGAAMPLSVNLLSMSDAPGRDARQSAAILIGRTIQPQPDVHIEGDVEATPPQILKTDCPIIDVFMPSLRHRVLALMVNGSVPPLVEPFLANNPNPKFTLTKDNMAPLKQKMLLQDLGSVDFDSRSGAPSPASVDLTITSLVAPIRGSIVLGVLAIYDSNAAPDDPTQIAQQAKFIASKVTNRPIGRFGAIGQSGPPQMLLNEPQAPVLTIVVFTLG